MNPTQILEMKRQIAQVAGTSAPVPISTVLELDEPEIEHERSMKCWDGRCNRRCRRQFYSVEEAEFSHGKKVRRSSAVATIGHIQHP